MMPDFISDPAWLNALFAGVAGLLTAWFVRGKTSQSGKREPAPHQELLRPETESEKLSAAADLRSAIALEQIAKVTETIERHLDFLIKTRG